LKDIIRFPKREHNDYFQQLLNALFDFQKEIINVASPRSSQHDLGKLALYPKVSFFRNHPVLCDVFLHGKVADELELLKKSNIFVEKPYPRQTF
jgi:hypothetical protein